MSDALEGNTKQPPSPTPKDVVAYIRGDATPEQTQLIRAALEDPNSQVNAWLRGIEEWAKESFPVVVAGIGRDVRPIESVEKLNAVLEFVRRKRMEKVITDADFAHITSEGGLSGMEPFPGTPAGAIAATSRIIGAINELHPELATEVAMLGFARSRS